jgi:integrase
VRRASFYKAWHTALAKTGVGPDLKPHDLRHLANTLAAKVPGTTLKDLMARLGQTSPQAFAALPPPHGPSRSRHGAGDRRRALASDGIRRTHAG